MSKRELLDAEDRSWHELVARFEAIAPDAWETPGASGEWCAKDVMSHIACWHAQITDWLEAYRSHGEKPTDIDFAAFNEKFHAECSDLDLHDVRVMSGASRHRMREEVSRIDDDISQGWMRLIATCLHEHYAEHIPDLDAFLGRTA